MYVHVLMCTNISMHIYLHTQFYEAVNSHYPSPTLLNLVALWFVCLILLLRFGMPNDSREKYCLGSIILLKHFPQMKALA